ncbi:MAG: molybdopterin-dependent oxidoreductase [Deltaproteobacteria bacterium]|nr:molybdopterin-dependent oxidoreductase [Deltaproteobacteria bacterium]
MTPANTHYRACTLCEAICGLEIQVAGGKILSIRGDKRDPLSRGHICPKAVALKDIQDDPDRVRYPMRRTASGLVRIPWDEAFDEAEARLRATQKAWGDSAVGVYLGNPNVHSYGSTMFVLDCVHALRTRNRFSATSVDQLPHMFCAWKMFGHQLLLPVPDVDRTHFLLIFGANPLASNGSMMTAPDIKKRLEQIQARGGRVVVVDPRRTETAALADRHIAIRPGHDAFLLAALLHVFFEEKLAKPGHLASSIDGIGQLEALLQPFSPERAAEHLTLTAAEIRELARSFCAAPSAACYGRLGVSAQEHGALCHWLINALNAITGNLDRPGGAMFPTPAVDLLGRMSRGHQGRWHSRVRGSPEVGGELPSAVMAEEMLTAGPGQIRAFVTIAGNPVLSTPNGAELDRALAGLDFMLSIDFYVNETTRHAHLILPPTAPLEHDHYDLALYMLAVRNTARYSPPVVAPPADTRHDWQILLELTTRLERRSTSTWARARLREAVLRHLGPRGLLDLGLRLGPHGLRSGKTGISLRHLERHPHGIDLGPLTSNLLRRLRTPDKRVHLMADFVPRALSRLHARLDAEPVANPQGLMLIGRRHLRSNNSWMHNAPRLVTGSNRCTLMMHPSDAKRLDLRDQQAVIVSSRVGEVRTIVELTETLMPGVVSLPHGWGHGQAGTRLQVAAKNPGVSINDLTDDRRLDEDCGNAAVNGVAVSVRALADQPVGTQAS